MNIDQLKHVLRAAAAITDEQEFVLVGSQAILVQHPGAPDRMIMSAEIDIFPLHRPDLAELIEGSIGGDSVFHETFGYHADGVGPATARLPGDWRGRAIILPGSSATGGATAIAPDIHDLTMAKLLAGRTKDIEWVEAGHTAGLIDLARVAALVPETTMTAEEQALLEARLARIERQPNE